MASLWSPETSNEVTFITKTFPATSGFYHLGIEQYVFGKGAFYSDNSYGVGVPFYTGSLHTDILPCCYIGCSRLKDNIVTQNMFCNINYP